MARRPSCGFTLVELLVIIAIAGLLAMMALPLMLHFREAGRRATCMNNLKNIGLSTQQYEGKFLRLPGYKNTVARDPSGGALLDGTWVIPLLPYFERLDLFRAWDANTPKSVFLKLLVCPNDSPKSTPPDNALLGYVANCGNGTQNPACGVFFDASDSAASKVSMSLDYLAQHDGSAITLMFTENVNIGNKRHWDFKDADVTIDRVGFRWDRGRINENISKDLPRPSSRHTGGAMVVFCDGHVDFLSEEISENVFQHLSTPDSAAAGVSGVLTDDY